MAQSVFPTTEPAFHRPLAGGFAGHHEVAGASPEHLPKLRELREDVCFRAEYFYLSHLVHLTGRNIRKACLLSGLSRSRLYSLLKKHQIAPPLTGQGSQG